MKPTIVHINKVVGCFAVILGVAASVPAQVQYAVVDIGSLPDYPWTRGQSLNNKGHVAGYGSPSGSFGSSLYRAFFWNGTMHDLGLLSTYDNRSAAYGLNDLDQVVGISEYYSPFSYYTADAFIWDYKNGIKNIIYPSNIGRSYEAFSINNSGASVGTVLSQSFGYFPLLFPGNGTEVIKTNANAWGHAFKINDLGCILTQSSRQYIPGDPQAFYIWAPDSPINYQVPLKKANDLNDLNVVCGEYEGIDGKTHACTWTLSSGKKDIPIPENKYSTAIAINNLGDVIGYYQPILGNAEYFIYSKEKLFRLNTLVPSGFIDSTTDIVDINDKGDILIRKINNISEKIHTYILTRDTDGDGIPDEWESSGKTINGLDLYGMGARPNHKDIFVYVDYTKSSSIINRHNHKLNEIARKNLISAFDSAPVNNPSDQDNKTGISLHIIQGIENGIEENDTNKELVVSNLEHKTRDWSRFDAIKCKYFPEAWKPIAHYCIMGHDGPMQEDLNRATGTSRDIPSSDFLVALPNPNNTSITMQSVVFMHELGHNLGLGHGGPILKLDKDQSININRKPNHLSVMNYAFAGGLIYDGKEGLLDYSRFNLPDLDEKNLNESIGLGDIPGLNRYGTRWYLRKPFWSSWSVDSIHFPYDTNDVTQAINWDESSVSPWPFQFPTISSSVSIDINHDKNNNLGILKSANEWNSLIFQGGLISSTVNGPSTLSLPAETFAYPEITLQDAEGMQPIEPRGISARLSGRTIRIAWNPTGPSDDRRYAVYRRFSGQDFTLLTTTAAALYQDLGLPIGATVYYYVTTVSMNGVESYPSSVISVVVR